MNLMWSPGATEDLRALGAYIAEEDPAVARRIVLRILDMLEQLLVNHPAMDRPGRVPGTRELVVAQTPYIIPYRVVRDEIQILRVYHSARRWPENF